MRKDNWRFEALARAKIVRQEEENKVKTISQLTAEAVKEMEGFGKLVIIEEDQDKQCAGDCVSCELDSADECRNLIEELC